MCSYLQLLPLHHETDGFLLFQQFACLRSPQLEGIFIDFCEAINKLTILNHEPLPSFHLHAMWVFNDIKIAQLQDGTNAALLEHFLDLL